MRSVAVAAVLVAAGGGCREKSAAVAVEGAPAEGSAASTAPTTAMGADAVIAQALQRAGDGMMIDHVVIRYVRADGVLDGRYGRLEATMIGPEKPLPPDDPNRPVGAPDERVRPPRDCRSTTWIARTGAWEDSSMCFTMGEPTGEPMHCSTAAVWQRAIADGAPKTALATINFGSMSGRTWDFTVEDQPRAIYFRKTYDDVAADCPPVAEVER